MSSKYTALIADLKSTAATVASIQFEELEQIADLVMSTQPMIDPISLFQRAEAGDENAQEFLKITGIVSTLLASFMNEAYKNQQLPTEQPTEQLNLIN